ncbi:PKD domain-containing protein [Georgenia ruanii]|uniref:PKD domain-containing protein n=1 Tax=Georgenia ruanii TaxID=348442 RepID=A0A7J9UU98_9MICO|nr:PKD domain-containing protein [Georgenia ruanii]MPV88082.1 PKD domain-containing protein [Georgenia ruanii]
MRRAGLALVAAGGLALAGTVAVVAPASADIAPADPSLPATVTADRLPTVQIDGVVWSQVVVGNTVYAAGSFATARPAGAAPGTNTVPRQNLLAYDIRTGALNASFAPNLNAQALTITKSPDGSRIFVGGDFTQVNGQARNRIAAFDTATGQLVAGFAPSVNGQVRAVAATSSAVYLGGTFSTVGGIGRTRLAAVAPSNGAVLSWAPRADDRQVDAMTMSPSGGKVIVGGRFTTLSGVAAYGMGALDASSGAVLPWPANQVVRDAGKDAGITSLAADGERVYGSGYHFGGGGNLENSFAADGETGQIVWVADCHGDTYSVFPMKGALYTTGHAHYCGNLGTGGFPQTEPEWTEYRSIAFSREATGVNKPDIYGYPDNPGVPSPTLLNWFPDVNHGLYTGQYQGPWHVTGNDEYLVLGGEFRSVNGTPQQGLVRFAFPQNAPKAEGPQLKFEKFLPRAVSLAAGTVRVSMPGNWDRDNATLTYRLYRDSETVPPVYEKAVTARFWETTPQGYLDTGLQPGATHRYRLTATDSTGNVAKSDWVSVTVSTQGQLSSYARKVLEGNPASYWRLGEPNGPDVYDWAGFSDATAGSGVSRGAAGAITGDTNAASHFNGTGTGTAATRTAQDGPNVFTAESWVRTTSTRGGKIIGFGNSATGNSSAYDRHVYMDNAGKIWFGVHPGGVRTVNSTASYNDGRWHHVVATLGANGMQLFVDGKRVAQRSDVTAAQGYSGYWRIGGDNLNGWTSQPASNYLDGDIDEVAVYPTVLSAAAVNDHFVAGGGTSSVPPAPSDKYGAAVYNADPDLYWRLNEQAGPTAQDAGKQGVPGTYNGEYQLQAAGALAGVNDRAVRFTGTGGHIASTAQFTNPSVYSLELWFSTTTTRGGKLIGFGASATGTSSNYDRHVYMQDDGRLVFGVWTGQTNTITTDRGYNDGRWHHMVATQSSGGMRLYVDGALAGTNPQTQAENYTGYWRVGGDTTWGSSSPFLEGLIDEAAVYSSELSANQVSEHYALGTDAPPPNVAPTAAFTSTAANLAASFDAAGSSDPDGTIASYAWDFGDGATGTGVKPSHTYAAAGTYTVRLTVTDNVGATGTVTHAVTVTAPQPGNVAPTAAFTSTAADLAASFDAAGSSDPDGTIASYAWDFGDGATGTGVTASHTYAAAGTYTVRLTVTDNVGATGTVSHAVTVTAPPGEAPLAADAFGRTVARGWGSADTGGPWSASGTGAVLDVADGVGRLTAPAAGRTSGAYLTGVSQTSGLTQVQVSLDKIADGGGSYVSVLGRRVNGQDYRLQARVLSNGTVTAELMRYTTSEVRLGNAVTVPGVRFAPGDVVNIVFEVTGTSPTLLRAKLWEQGMAEPSTWLISATDSTASLQAPGGIGLLMYLSSSATNAPVTARFDNLTVRKGGA